MAHVIPHKTFHHIVNVSCTSHLKKCSESSVVIVEEKVDGSNFYFASDGTSAVCGKKSDILNDTCSFYNFQKLLYLKKSIMELHKRLNIHDATIYLYGELIPTQKRIKYVTDDSVHFIAFNLRVIPFAIENEENTHAIWMPKQEWCDIATECGFKVVPTLMSGSLIDCIKYNVENAKSCIPALIGNPSLILPIEGVVIKGCGITLKKKAIAFRETESGGGLRVKINAYDPIMAEVTKVLSEMLTISRLDNIVSEIGDKMEPDAYRLSNTVVLDAIKECKDDDDSIVLKISGAKRTKIQKELAGLFMDTVKEHMGW